MENVAQQAETHIPGPWHVNGVGYRRDESSPTGRRCYLTTPDGRDDTDHFVDSNKKV